MGYQSNQTGLEMVLAKSQLRILQPVCECDSESLPHLIVFGCFILLVTSQWLNECTGFTLQFTTSQPELLRSLLLQMACALPISQSQSVLLSSARNPTESFYDIMVVNNFRNVYIFLVLKQALAGYQHHI